MTIWAYGPDGVSSKLKGGRADRRGRLTVRVDTGVAASDPGLQRVCMQGRRSRRVACASFRLVAAPDTSPGSDEELDSESDPDQETDTSSDTATDTDSEDDSASDSGYEDDTLLDTGSSSLFSPSLTAPLVT